MQGRLTVISPRVHVRACAEQHPDDFRVRILRRKVQWSPVPSPVDTEPARAHVHLRAGCEQRAHDAGVAALGGVVQRRAVAAVAPVQRRTRLQKRSDDGRVAGRFGGSVEWTVAKQPEINRRLTEHCSVQTDAFFDAAGYHVGCCQREKAVSNEVLAAERVGDVPRGVHSGRIRSEFKERGHDIRMVRCQVQWGRTCLGAGVDVCPGFQQHDNQAVSNAPPARVHSGVERGPAPGVAGVDIGAGFQQRPGECSRPRSGAPGKAATGNRVQGGTAKVGLPSVHVHPGLEKHCENLQCSRAVTPAAGQIHERRVAIVAMDIQGCAGFHAAPHTLDRKTQQGVAAAPVATQLHRPASLILCDRGRAQCDELVDHL